MLALLSWLWNGIKSVAALVTPVFDKEGLWRGISRTLRWIIHVVLLAVILVGLHFLNTPVLHLDQKIPSIPILAQNWLPILFLLFYLLVWLAWGLSQLIVPEEIDSDFPDIDAAWDEAVQALRQAGARITDLPLFLVLGRPAGGEKALVQAAFPPGQKALRVPGVPAAADAAIHIYANVDGIYVTCPGASLSGEHARRLSAEPQAVAAVGGMPEEESTYATMVPTDHLQDVAAILSRAKSQGRELTETEQEEIRRLMGQEQAEHAATVRSRRPSLLRETAVVDTCVARLAHLCRIIVRDRRPYCPINGTLLLLPWAATDTDDDANQTAEVYRTDLKVARQVLKVMCPQFAMVCDMENAVGFREFLQHVPDKDRQRRVGQRFPLAPDLNGEGLDGMIESGLQWICTSMFPTWVYKYFHLEEGGGEDRPAATRTNVRLYQVLVQLLERQRRFSRILTHGLVREEGEPLLFGGCYLTATGANAAKEQAFVPGVFQRLVEEQNNVSWTSQALAEDSKYGQYAQLASVALGIFLLVVVAGGVFLFVL
jgi:hypothetical protein